jgi:hypothetical protein
MQISEEQMQAFAPQMQRQFEETCAVVLRSTYPEITAPHPHEKLLELIRFGTERAARHGIVANEDVERWLHLMMRLGPRFDDDPRHTELAAILSDANADAKARLYRVEILTGIAVQPPDEESS